MTRLFNLDFQLIHDAVIVLISVFFLFLILSYNLFNPVRKMLEDRKNKIKGELDDAAENQKEADRLRAEYEAKMAEADKQAENILQEARKKAQLNEERILKEAKEEASRIRKRALEEARLEQNRVQDDIKKEMVSVAAAMASKVISSRIDTTIQDELVDETLKEMDGSTWQN
jgi:F-type H+-transporting ATPase subunit b